MHLWTCVCGCLLGRSPTLVSFCRQWSPRTLELPVCFLLNALPRWFDVVQSFPLVKVGGVTFCVVGGFLQMIRSMALPLGIATANLLVQTFYASMTGGQNVEEVLDSTALD